MLNIYNSNSFLGSVKVTTLILCFKCTARSISHVYHCTQRYNINVKHAYMYIELNLFSGAVY
jgi:hypothetical protein